MSRTGARTVFQLLIQSSGTGSRVQVRGLCRPLVVSYNPGHLVPDKRNTSWKTISGVGGCKMQAAKVQLKYHSARFVRN